MLGFIVLEIIFGIIISFYLLFLYSALSFYLATKTKYALYFVFVLIFATIWISSLYSFQSSYFINYSLAIARTIWFGALMTTAFLLLYSYSYRYSLSKTNNSPFSIYINLVFVLLISIVAGISLLTSLVVSSAEIETQKIVYGSFYLIAISAVGTGSLAIIYNLLKARQILYGKNGSSGILLGMVITLTIAISTNIVVPNILGSSQYSILGIFSSIPVVVAISIAMFRHQYFDFRVLIGRITYIGSLAGMTYLIFFGLITIYLQLFNAILVPQVYLVSVFISIAFVLSYNALNDYMRTQVRSRLLNPGYDPINSIENLNKQLAVILSTEKIFEYFENIIKTTIRPSKILVITAGQGKPIKINTPLIKDISMEQTFKLYWDVKTYEPILMHRLFLNAKNVYSISNSVFQIFNSSKTRVALPIKTSDQLKCIILIGQKEGDAPYTQQDAEFLKSIATVTSVAIERSLLYSEVQDFANSLQEKVDIATKELKDTNIELEETLEQIQEARRKERDMMDVMGHELRTPMTIVRNALAMLDRERAKNGNVSPERLQDYLQKGLDAARREITLIETLLSATKVDASRLQLNLEKVSVRKLILDGIEGHKALITEKELDVVYNSETPDHFIFADAVRSHEIVDNFISNAIKYTPSGSIYISHWESNGKIWVEVRDTGMGIDQKDLENLGKKFFRAKQHIKGKDVVRPGGTGLGLYVTFELIRIQGGQLYINSEVGKGTSFTFGLPMYVGQQSNQYDQTFDAGQVESRQHIFLNQLPPAAPSGL